MTADNKAIALQKLQNLARSLKAPGGTKVAASEPEDKGPATPAPPAVRKRAAPKVSSPALILEPSADPSNRELRLIDAGAAIALDQPTDADRAFLGF